MQDKKSDACNRVGRITDTHVHRVVGGLLSVYFTWKTSEEVCVVHSRLPVELQCTVILLPSNLKGRTMCTPPDMHTTCFSANIHSWYVDAEWHLGSLFEPWLQNCLLESSVEWRAVLSACFTGIGHFSWYFVMSYESRLTILFVCLHIDNNLEEQCNVATAKDQTYLILSFCELKTKTS